MAQSALPQPGDVVGGKYRIERMLGRGGMGAVFEVIHCVTDKRFAIKWLLADPSVSEAVTARFVREAQVAGRCDHRNIVEVYDIDREAGTLFLVMELLTGESLAERLTLHGPISYRETCRLLVPCIEAVSEAHVAGIIHRDLKPANIFICRARGREPELAKVLDFGVSRFSVPTGSTGGTIGTKTANGAVLGTPFYMAPEQMRGHAIDKRVDVYSMGVTLYEVIAGVRPYDATTFGDLLMKVSEGKHAPLKTLVRELPARLSDVIDRALATDREARFASMEELAHALEPFCVAQGSAPTLQSAPSLSGLSGDTPWSSEGDADFSAARRRSFSIGLGATALIAAAITVPFVWHKDPETSTQPRVAPVEASAPTPPPSAASVTSVTSVTSVNGLSQADVLPAALDAGIKDAVNKIPIVQAGRRMHGTHVVKSAAGATATTGIKLRAAAAEPDKFEAAPEADDRSPAKTRAPARLDRSDFK